MAECLSALQRIVESRLTGIAANGEEQEWETHVEWLLDAYEKIGHVRGQRFGFHLSNLVCVLQAGPYHTQTEVKSPKVSHIGQNIERLKKECGWSYDELAAKTGLDKKQIIYHVKGRAKPRPGTLKLYSQAFTKELGRPISPADLDK